EGRRLSRKVPACAPNARTIAPTARNTLRTSWLNRKPVPQRWPSDKAQARETFFSEPFMGEPRGWSQVLFCPRLLRKALTNGEPGGKLRPGDSVPVWQVG